MARFGDRLRSFFRASDADRSVAGPSGAPVETRADTLGKPSEWLMLALGGGTSSAGMAVGPDTARGIAAAYACIDLRSRLMASLPLKLYRKDAQGRVEDRDHPAARLFSQRPNGAQTRASFIAWSQQNIDTRGNACARVVRNSFFEPVALLPVRPGEIDPLLTEAGDVVYRYRGKALTRADLLHVPGNDLRASDGIWGVSPVQRLRETFGLALATQDHAARHMANGATPTLFFESATKPDPAQAQNFIAQWMANNSGVNKGKPAIANIKPHVLGVDPQKSQVLESRGFDVAEVCRVYGVPGELVGAPGASSWGTGIGEKIQGFVKFTIATICTNWEQALDLTLLTEAERAAGYYFAFTLEALLRGDLKSRAEIYKVFREIAAIDVNQIRELEDWPLYPDAWAGDPRQPLNNQGGGQGAAKPAAAPAATP